jgi:drug/metabolite transporter (DMT)-like permease
VPMKRIMSQVKRGAPILALIGACLFWGTSDVATKAALNDLPPITLTTLRFGLATVVLWPFARRQTGSRVPIREALPLGLIGITLMFLLQNIGMTRIAASNASVLQGATPALTILVAAVVAGERIGRHRLVAIGLALAGVLYMSQKDGSGLAGPGLGDGLVLSSMLMFAIFIVISKRAFQRCGTAALVFAISGCGTAALIPAAVAEIAVVQPGVPDSGTLLLVLYLGIGCSALTYALWGFALRNLEIGCVAAFDALIPVTGCAAAAVFLGEHLNRNHVFGSVAVIAALGIIAFEQSHRTGRVVIPELAAASEPTLASAP